jgi:hypothetical protein
MDRCYLCGKTVHDDEAIMVNVLLPAGGQWYSYTARRYLFHRTCAAKAKEQSRRAAGIALLITLLVVSVAALSEWACLAPYIGLVGGMVTLALFFQYT